MVLLLIFVAYVFNVVNNDHSARVIQPPGEDFEGVDEVDPPSNSGSVLVDDLALPPPSLPNNSAPTPVQKAPTLLQQ